MFDIMLQPVGQCPINPVFCGLEPGLAARISRYRCHYARPAHLRVLQAWFGLTVPEYMVALLAVLRVPNLLQIRFQDLEASG